MDNIEYKRLAKFCYQPERNDYRENNYGDKKIDKLHYSKYNKIRKVYKIRKVSLVPGFILMVSQMQDAIYFSIIAMPKKSHFAIFPTQSFVENTKKHT